MVLPSPHTHPRERTLAAMLLESRRPPTGLPSELKLLLRKLANAIAQGASEIVLPPGYAATERSFLQAGLRPRSFPETCHPAHTGEAEQQFQRKPITDSDRCRAVWL
jgi:hypothetical protein